MEKGVRFISRVAIVVSLIGAGLWLRSLQTARVGAQSIWGLWPARTTVTLYFSDGRFLFPVSRRLQSNGDALARATLQALLAGPRAGARLKSPVSPAVEIRSLRVENGVVHADLSALPDPPDARTAAETAIVETMTALRGVTLVELRVQGTPLGPPAKRTPLLYFASANGLTAVPIGVTNPREALESYLSGPPAPELIGLPPDVRLLGYEQARDGLLSLKFSYTPSLRALAIDRPDRVRTVLLGLIASLTEFSEVRAVQLDFGGQSRLGLGQCSDLLNAPQPRPALLNDERLL